MSRVIFLVSMMLLYVADILAAEDIVLSTAAKPAQAWVGQKVVLEIDVLGNSGWAQISRFGDMQLTGAYLIRPQNQGIRLQQNIEGVAYTGQRYELSLYPQQAGAIEVPPIAVEVTIKAWGVNASQSKQWMKTPALRIEAKQPPGTSNVRGLISSSGLIAEQRWVPIETDQPQVGDTLQRVVTLQADNVLGMAFAPLEFTPQSGLGIYPAQPVVNDKAERGSLIGQRSESVTYVFERKGPVQIPDIELTWWNIVTAKLETVILPGREFDVVAGPASSVDAMEDSASSRLSGRGLWLVAAVVMVVATLLASRKPLIRRWRLFRQRQLESERLYFRQTVKSIRSRDARQALRAIIRWLDRIDSKNEPALLSEFLAVYADKQLKAQIDILLEHVHEDNSLQATTALIHGLSKARKRWQKTQSMSFKQNENLPELN